MKPTSLIKSFLGGSIDILAVDIEGMDVNAIRQVLGDKIFPKVILFETCGEKPELIFSFIRELEDKGYTVIGNNSMQSPSILTNIYTSK